MIRKQKPNRAGLGFAEEDEGRVLDVSTSTIKPDFLQLVGAFDKDSMTAVVLLPREVE